MENENDLYTIPLMIPRTSRTNSQNNESTTINNITTNTDSNGNTINEQGFVVQLTFNNSSADDRRPVLKLQSRDLEDEATRIQDHLESTRLILAGYDSELGGLEQSSSDLNSAAKDELRHMQSIEQEMKGWEEKLAQSRRLAEQSTQELEEKAQAAKAARMKRFETERVLRELQMTVVRRKLEQAEAEDDEDMEKEPDEDEIKIGQLLKEMDELSEANNFALCQLQMAEEMAIAHKNELSRMEKEVEQRMMEGRRERGSHQMNASEKKSALERNLGQQTRIEQQRRAEKLKEIELLQRIVLVHAARELEQLEQDRASLIKSNKTN